MCAAFLKFVDTEDVGLAFIGFMESKEDIAALRLAHTSMRDLCARHLFHTISITSEKWEDYPTARAAIRIACWPTTVKINLSKYDMRS